MAVYNIGRDGRIIEDMSKVVITPEEFPVIYEIMLNITKRVNQEACNTAN